MAALQHRQLSWTSPSTPAAFHHDHHLCDHAYPDHHQFHGSLILLVSRGHDRPAFRIRVAPRVRQPLFPQLAGGTLELVKELPAPLLPSAELAQLQLRS